MATENAGEKENKKAGEAAKKRSTAADSKTPIKKKKIIIVTGSGRKKSGQLASYSSGHTPTGDNGAVRTEAPAGAETRPRREAIKVPHKIIRSSVKPTVMEVDFHKPKASVRKTKKTEEPVVSKPAAPEIGAVPKCLTSYVPVGPEIGLVGRDRIVDDLCNMLDEE